MEKGTAITLERNRDEFRAGHLLAPNGGREGTWLMKAILNMFKCLWKIDKGGDKCQTEVSKKAGEDRDGNLL